MELDHNPITTTRIENVSGDEPKQISEDEAIREPSLPQPIVESNLADALKNIPQLIDREAVIRMINLQVAAIDRLETTNKSLTNCNTMAQNKLASTTKLFKKASKQISDSKRDLDIIYKKIVDLKAKIKQDRPDLFAKVQPADEELEATGTETTETKTETNLDETIERQC